VEDSTYDALGAADLAIVSSGTATLEAALMDAPMIVILPAGSRHGRHRALAGAYPDVCDGQSDRGETRRARTGPEGFHRGTRGK